MIGGQRKQDKRRGQHQHQSQKDVQRPVTRRR
jgi:hypothetical protein